jgi:hypothetical protein
METKKIDARYPVFGAENYVRVFKKFRDVIYLNHSGCYTYHLHFLSEVLSFAHAFWSFV